MQAYVQEEFYLCTAVNFKCGLWMNAWQVRNGFQAQNETWPVTDIYKNSLVFTGRSRKIISAGALEVKNIGEVSK